MRPQDWLFRTLSMAVAAGALIAGVSVAADPFGLYHSGPAQRLVYGDPRLAKYLLNYRHVPENFNAIMIGPSLSANWDMRGIERLRVYNDSLNGGNSVEEAAIVSAAMSKPGIAAAFVIVHPALTFTHDFKTVRLSPELKRSTLGSMGLWQALMDMVNIRIGRMPQRFDWSGTEQPEFVSTRMNENMKRLWGGGAEFEVDPEAIDAYRGMIRQLRSRRVHIIFVVPPTVDNLLETKRAAFDRYTAAIRSEMAGDGDEWVDFTAPEYRYFRANAANFVDGVHFTVASAREMVEALNSKVNASIHSGMLRLPNPAH